MGVCWLTLVELCMCVCYSGTCCRETTVQKCLINKEKEMQIDTGFVWSLPIFSCFYASMLLFVSSSARDSQTPRARAWGLRACCVEGASTAKEETCWAPGGKKDAYVIQGQLGEEGRWGVGSLAERVVFPPGGGLVEEGDGGTC